MRKKCNRCGLIGFTTDASCKRCGSDALTLISIPDASPAHQFKSSPKSLSIRNYLTYGFLAVVIEIVASSPIWLLIGSGPGGDSSGFVRLAFILNLPTVLVTWCADKLSGFNIYFTLVFTPFTQIIFWFCLFIYLGHRRNKMK
jgi:hypothetical protein